MTQMRTSRQRPTKLFVRVAFYVLVMAAVFIYRGQQVQRGLGFRLSSESDTVTTITLVGRELAPDVIPRLVANYHRDYPRLHVLVEDGGTARALEAIANHPATVGLLYRPPKKSEQAIIKAAVGDSVLYFPVALGGIAVLVNAASGVDSLTLDDLRGFLGDEMNAHFEHFYAPDPNQGLWDAFRSSLEIPEAEEVSPRVIFLKDENVVAQAVAADPRGIGIASTLSLPDSLSEKGIRIVKIKRDAASAAVEPAYEKIGYGEYPLHHYLYVACLANGGVRAAMFVTQLTSDRGQRQIERAGVLPARQTARSIVLTRNPVGSTH
jgi:ABC-type phosphate transport system substrate-binding protein